MPEHPAVQPLVLATAEPTPAALETFTAFLSHFWAGRGKKSVPGVELFFRVQQMGGFAGVTSAKHWSRLRDQLGIDVKATAATGQLRKLYEQWLLPVEVWYEQQGGKPVCRDPPAAAAPAQGSVVAEQAAQKAATTPLTASPDLTSQAGSNGAQVGSDSVQRSKRSNEAKGAPSGATGVSSEQSKRQRTHSPAATPAAHDAASQRRSPAAQAAGDTPGPKFTPMRCSPVGSQQRPSAEQKHSQGSPRAASTASQSASAGLNAPAAVRTSAHAAAGPASPSGTQARGHLQRQARTQGTASSLDVSSQQIEKLGVLLMSGEAPSIARALNTLLVLSNPAVCSIRPRFVPKLLPGLCAAVTLPHEVTATDLAALTPEALQGATDEAAPRTAAAAGQRVPTAEEGVHACAIAAATVIFHFAQISDSQLALAQAPTLRMLCKSQLQRLLAGRSEGTAQANVCLLLLSALRHTLPLMSADTHVEICQELLCVVRDTGRRAALRSLSAATIAALLASPAGSQALGRFGAAGLAPLDAAEVLLCEHADSLASAAAAEATHTDSTPTADDSMDAFWRAHAVKHSAALAHTVVAVAAESGWLSAESAAPVPVDATASAPAHAARAVHSLESIAASLNVAGPQAHDFTLSPTQPATTDGTEQSGNESTAKRLSGMWNVRTQQQSAFDLHSEMDEDGLHEGLDEQYAAPEQPESRAGQASEASAAGVQPHSRRAESPCAAQAGSDASHAASERSAQGAGRNNDGDALAVRDALPSPSPLSQCMDADAMRDDTPCSKAGVCEQLAPPGSASPAQEGASAKAVASASAAAEAGAVKSPVTQPEQTETASQQRGAAFKRSQSTQPDEGPAQRAAQTPQQRRSTPSTVSPAPRSPRRPGSGRTCLARSGSAASDGRGGSLAAIASKDSLHSLPSFSRWASLSLSRSLSLGPLVQCAIVDGVDARLGGARASESQGSPTSVAGHNRTFAEFPSPRAISRALSVGTSLETAPTAPASHWGALELLFSQGEGETGSAASSAKRCSLSSRRESTTAPAASAALSVPDLSAALQATVPACAPQMQRRMSIPVPAGLVAVLCRLVVSVARPPGSVCAANVSNGASAEDMPEEHVQAKVLSESRQMHVQAAQMAAKALRLCFDVPQLARQVKQHAASLTSTAAAPTGMSDDALVAVLQRLSSGAGA